MLQSTGLLSDTGRVLGQPRKKQDFFEILLSLYFCNFFFYE